MSLKIGSQVTFNAFGQIRTAYVTKQIRKGLFELQVQNLFEPGWHSIYLTPVKSGQKIPHSGVSVHINGVRYCYVLNLSVASGV